MKIALLGLTGSGKKTFFSLLTERGDTEPEQQTTMHGLLKRKGVRREGESLTGNAAVKDKRLEMLGRISGKNNVVFAENTIVLCPDVVSGSKHLKWLETARRCELLCILLRAFEADITLHHDDYQATKRDMSIMESELIIADLELIEKRLDRIAKEKRGSDTALLEREQCALEKIKSMLDDAPSSFPISLQAQDAEPVKHLGLLTMKPVLWAYNVDEKRLTETSGREDGNFMISCRIEQEIMELESVEEQKTYLRELGAAGSGIERLNEAAYKELGLISFYTIGKDEVRAWAIRKGSTAPEAAGKVHSDIERGFIRAEIINYEDMVAAGSEAAVKSAGKMRLAGKDYVIEDGDICRFRFNI